MNLFRKVLTIELLCPVNCRVSLFFIFSVLIYLIPSGMMEKETISMILSDVPSLLTTLRWLLMLSWPPPPDEH